MTPKICLIHGHGASAESFNFLRSELDAEFIALEYDSKNGFAANLSEMAERLADEPRVFFVAHSLGGLYALHLAGQLGERAVGAVTMGTPYGGCESAPWLSFALALKLQPPSQLYADIQTYAPAITGGRAINLHNGCNWTAIVTTKGHSNLMAAANDGVCSLNSMYDRKGVTFLEVSSTHHECLLSQEVAAIVRGALDQCMERAA